MTATCKLCGCTDSQVEFYKGVNCRCKECHKREVRKNRAEKFEQYQQYEKMRFKRDPHRAEMNKAWAKTEKGKASHARSVATRNAREPDKRAANIILGNAVRDGKIDKPLNCSRCNSIPPRRQMHAHHHDYSKPLDVEWFCAQCHGVEHHGNAPPPTLSKKPRGRHVSREKRVDTDNLAG